MKPLLISTNDLEGGAARAAYRLHQSLRSIDIASHLWVQNKDSGDGSVTSQKSAIAKVGERLNGLPLELYRDRVRTTFSPQWFPDGIAAKAAQFNADVINLHWICNGYVQIETLAKFQKPLVWTLHDMWPFTGGCHYGQGCDRYTQSCGSCPLLKSDRQRDVSQWIWQRKARIYPQLNLTVVAPSHWMAELARQSSLFRDKRVEVIPHGLDTTVYQPVDRNMARQLLNLPLDKHLILFGAGSNAIRDPRKGLMLLQQALQKLQGWSDRAELVIFGAPAPQQAIDFGFKVHYLGRFYDDLSLVVSYAAADVMIVPSVQEAFGQTASESLACGTPVVAFRATGLKDIVSHRQDGYLAEPFAAEDLAAGIAWVLEDRQRHQELRVEARAKAKRQFTLELQARRYGALFAELA